MGATLTKTTRIRPRLLAWRLAVLLMVIAMGGCDNVEWGGIDLAIVPPPAHAPDTAAADPISVLPEGPVLFYVRRDTLAATVIPVGQVSDGRLTRIVPGQDIDAFADRFISAFLAPETELALFRRGRRVGTLTVDSAGLPAGPACRPLPRATGRLRLSAGPDDADEFLALDAASVPGSLPESDVRAARSMEVVSDMLAGEMLDAREAAVPSVTAARRQVQPFPLAGSADPGFTATYLVQDSLGLGNDNTGAALFVVFTPQGQTGYDTAFVGFADYGTGGKAAPRVIDFLDWNDDGNVELLLEVFGTRTSWFRAVGLDDGRWRAIFQDRCDPRTTPLAIDTVDAEPDQPAPPPSRPARQRPTPTPQPTTPTPTTQRGSALDSIPIIEPRVQISNPDQTPSIRRDTQRDTVPPDSGGGGG